LAGIGFELRKLFRRGRMADMVGGVIYASLTTIGPMIIVITALILMYGILGFSKISHAERDVVVSTILYIFIFSFVTASPLNSVISRYIADKFFTEELENIMASFYMTLAINVAFSALIGIPFAILEYVKGGINPILVFISYATYLELVMVFVCMIYVSALKEYRKISMAFLIGIGVALILAIFFFYVLEASVLSAILGALFIGFGITAFQLFSYIKRFFYHTSDDYREVWEYIKKFKGLVFANLFYALGLYSHNFMFWFFSEYKIVVAKVFTSAPIYDVATCIAMFSCISTLVIFVVQVETNFHDKFQGYCEAIIGAARTEIEAAKQLMIRVLGQEILFIVQVQFIITVIVFVFALILLPPLGFGGIIMRIYPVLTAAYLAVFVMYEVIIFQYYFNDIKGAMLTALVFMVTAYAASYLATFLPPELYGLGFFTGGYCGFAAGFFRLRYIIKNLDRHIFCRGNITEVSTDKERKANIFRKGDPLHQGYWSE